MNGLRKCGICGVEKQVLEFSRRGSGNYIGALLHCCKDCNRNRVRKWNKLHPGATATRNHRRGISQSYTTNTDCSNWIGVYRAEEMTKRLFPDLIKMEWGNSGYDFISEDGIKLDVKSSRLRRISERYEGWQFVIDRNIIANEFLCYAFGSGKNPDCLHIWRIPSTLINRLKRLAIYNREWGLQKWAKYELPTPLFK